MSAENLISAKAALDALWRTLELEATIAEREMLENLSLTVEHLPSERVVDLTEGLLANLRSTIGKCLKLELWLEDLMEYSLDSEPIDAALEQLKASAKPGLSLRLVIFVDKMNLFHAANTSADLTFGYFCAEAFERFLKADFKDLGEGLWPGVKSRRTSILIVDTDIYYPGDLILVAGGRHMNRASKLAATNLTPGRLEEIQKERDRSIRWQQDWCSGLTPIHFYSPSDGQSSIERQLRAHFANSVFLYLADRTVSQEASLVSIFAWGRSTTEIYHLPPGSAPQLSSTGTDNLMRLFSWIYEGSATADRLPIAQMVVADKLASQPPESRAELLICSANLYLENSQFQWKLFIERKITQYTEDMRKFEDYIRQTAAGLREQVGTLTKGVSDSMLATVTALIGAFVAAGLSATFNPDIYKAAIWLYAVYLGLIPGAYQMTQNYDRSKSIELQFETTKNAFANRLSEERIAELVGTQFSDAKKLFNKWFYLTCFIYCVAPIAFLALGYCVITFRTPQAIINPTPHSKAIIQSDAPESYKSGKIQQPRADSSPDPASASLSATPAPEPSATTNVTGP